MRFENKDILKPILLLGLISIFLSILFPCQVKAECSFWAAISDKVPEDVILDQLFNLPNSLRYQSKANNDGWGIGYYDNSDAVFFKGITAAELDQYYNTTVMLVAHLEPKIIVAHVRKATSGCRDGVPNPHPFKRFKHGKYWLFGHNGTIDKDILIKLIGDDYFNKNLPNTCTYDPPDSWVDSELYFILILKHIENNEWDVEKGIKDAIFELETVISDGVGLNFFLTDGDVLWSFRKGHPLYYYYQLLPQYSAVASVFPYSDKGDWIEVPEDYLVVMKPGLEPVLKTITVPVAQLDRASAF